MDLTLWEPWDDQVHVCPFDNQSSYCNAIEPFSDLYLWHDVIEEDALNTKYCIQVLRILMDKADDEIVKLEEDIVMLQCQLAWDDEHWSKPCSAAVRDKIDYLENLTRPLETDNKEEVNCSVVESEQLKLPPRLHDLVKPLLDNYSSAKIKQISGSCGLEFGKKSLGATRSQQDKKLDEKECSNLKKSNKRNSLVMDLEDKIINDSHKTAKDPNKLQRKRMPVSAPAKSGWRSFNKTELFYQMIKDSTTGTRADKEVFRVETITQSRARYEKNAANSPLKLQETELRIAQTMKCLKQIAEASNQTRQATTDRCVMVKGKRTKFSGKSEALETQLTERKDTNSSPFSGLFNGITKHPDMLKINTAPKIELPQIPEIKNLVFNMAKPTSSWKPEKKRPSSSSSTQTLKEQTSLGALETSGKSSKKHAQQDSSLAPVIDISSDDSLTSRKKRKLTQNIRDRTSIRKFLMKLEKPDDEIPGEEANLAIIAKDSAANPPLMIEDGSRLLLKDLRAIGKARKIPGYYKLRKAELQKRLGLEVTSR
ncbi:uncharacterized protein LOC127264987 isoform X2 [Andrographis paniculata]|uniref:uncharacterized protein LOC127264987 isoform X2 n=1 Tax=Andrographis paniculata TaxID=175694 RepID=UPI0021E758A3|nr:uncharacterized protein LOC127264987 isoform X2 [Andrographis paniculata]